mmetsp:Transcript_92464/g.288218  ORF Transcript_92464/g.288218 Transcript_92464/m.288218 type:complete len:189 (-) Transcript_92464:133-699(-)
MKQHRGMRRKLGNIDVALSRHLSAQTVAAFFDEFNDCIAQYGPTKQQGTTEATTIDDESVFDLPLAHGSPAPALPQPGDDALHVDIGDDEPEHYVDNLYECDFARVFEPPDKRHCKDGYDTETVVRTNWLNSQMTEAQLMRAAEAEARARVFAETGIPITRGEVDKFIRMREAMDRNDDITRGAQTRL